MKLQKETDRKERHGKWYDDACGTAFAMELVGERWSLLVVRELMLGGRRFSELRRALNGISAKVLTERLESLETAGAVRKTTLPPPASVQVYELTEWGKLAEPAIQELGRWAATSPLHDPTLPLSPVSFMISLRTMLNPVSAQHFDGVFGFEMGGESFVARLTAGQLPVTRGSIDEADVRFHAPAPMHLAALFYGKVPPVEWERQSDCRIEGDRKLAKLFLDLFELPMKIMD